jgi:hypothetical protein
MDNGDLKQMCEELAFFIVDSDNDDVANPSNFGWKIEKFLRREWSKELKIKKAPPNKEEAK